jgi:hypothetical protein
MEEQQYPVFKLSAQGGQQIRMVLGPDSLLIDTVLGGWTVPLEEVVKLRDWLDLHTNDKR